MFKNVYININYNIMNEEQLLKTFEEYKGSKLDDLDILGNIAFKVFCAGYELKEKEL